MVAVFRDVRVRMLIEVVFAAPKGPATRASGLGRTSRTSCPQAKGEGATTQSRGVVEEVPWQEGVLSHWKRGALSYCCAWLASTSNGVVRLISSVLCWPGNIIIRAHVNRDWGQHHNAHRGP